MTQLAASAANVTLAWNPSTDTSVAGYNLYYGGSSGNYTNEISAGNATNCIVSGLLPGVTYYFAATAYNVIGLESTPSIEANYLVPATGVTTNQPPTLDAIGNLSLNENAGLQSVSLSGISSGAANENQTLTVTAVSGNTSLIPNPTVNYTSPNATGSLTFTPVANAYGTAIITVTVNDGGASSNIVTRTFTVTVAAVNNTPTLNTIGNLSLNESAGQQTVNLSGISSGAANESQTLTVSAVSGNTSLIPNPTVTYSSPNTTGSLTFTPVANAYGSAIITVTVNDGGTSNNIVTRTFTVTVAAVNNAPTLNTIGNLSLNESAGQQTVNLSGISSGAANESQTLTVSAVSGNTSLIPNPTVNYSSPNTTGSLTFTPVANANGSAIITVTVNDGGTSNNIVTRAFTVTVNAGSSGSTNQPTLDPITDMVVSANGPLQTVKLRGITPGTANGNQMARLCASTDDNRLVSRIRVHYFSEMHDGTLTFWPGSAPGTATVSVTVDNGEQSNNLVTRTFKVTVVASDTSTNPAAPATGKPVAAAVLTPAAHAVGQFALSVTGTAEQKYVVEASTDLTHWAAVETNTAPFIFVDPAAGKFPQRFYRAISAP